MDSRSYIYKDPVELCCTSVRLVNKRKDVRRSASIDKRPEELRLERKFLVLKQHRYFSRMKTSLVFVSRTTILSSSLFDLSNENQNFTFAI